MTNTLTLSFTAKDIDYAQLHGFKNAALRLLSMHSDTLWRLTDCGVGMEVVPPYHSVIVHEDDLEQWNDWIQHGLTAPGELRLEIHDEQFNNDDSLEVLRQEAIARTARASNRLLESLRS